MSAATIPEGSLRLEEAESNRLAWAFGISLALHLLVFGTYYTGKKFHVWENLSWPAWLRPVKTLADALKKRPPPVPLNLPPKEPPLMFVDVSPAQQTTEPPKDAKFYSSRNSQAANQQADVETSTPKITGAQTEIVRTADVPRPDFKPLQPSPPVQPVQEQQEEQKPKAAEVPGDLTMAKPDPVPKKEDGKDQRSKPKSWKEAMARQLQQDNRLVGQKMKQEGGVKRRLINSSLDAKATPFGTYDAALIEAVQYRWYTLLDQREYASESRGKVVITFRLHYDGRVTEVNMAENTAGEVMGLICERAITDQAPYPQWPPDMRLANRGDTRDIQFTFYYN